LLIPYAQGGSCYATHTFHANEPVVLLGGGRREGPLLLKEGDVAEDGGESYVIAGPPQDTGFGLIAFRVMLVVPLPQEALMERVSGRMGEADADGWRTLTVPRESACIKEMNTRGVILIGDSVTVGRAGEEPLAKGVLVEICEDSLTLDYGDGEVVFTIPRLRADNATVILAEGEDKDRLAPVAARYRKDNVTVRVHSESERVRVRARELSEEDKTPDGCTGVCSEECREGCSFPDIREAASALSAIESKLVHMLKEQFFVPGSTDISNGPRLELPLALSGGGAAYLGDFLSVTTPNGECVQGKLAVLGPAFYAVAEDDRIAFVEPRGDETVEKLEDGEDVDLALFLHMKDGNRIGVLNLSALKSLKEFVGVRESRA
jgi:hypothetical protein